MILFIQCFSRVAAGGRWDSSTGPGSRVRRLRRPWGDGQYSAGPLVGHVVSSLVRWIMLNPSAAGKTSFCVWYILIYHLQLLLKYHPLTSHDYLCMICLMCSGYDFHIKRASTSSNSPRQCEFPSRSTNCREPLYEIPYLLKLIPKHLINKEAGHQSDYE